MYRLSAMVVCSFFVVAMPLAKAVSEDRGRVHETQATFVTALPCESSSVWQLEASAYLPDVLYGICPVPESSRQQGGSSTRLFSLDLGQSPVKVETFNLPASYPDLNQKKTYNEWRHVLEIGPKSFAVVFNIGDESSGETLDTGFALISLLKGTAKPIVLPKQIDFKGPLYTGFGQAKDSDGNAVSSIHPYQIQNAAYLVENKSLYFHVQSVQAKVKDNGYIVSNPDVVMQYQMVNDEPTLKYYRDIFYSGARMAISGRTKKRHLIMLHNNGEGEIYFSVLNPLYKLMVEKWATEVPKYAKSVLDSFPTVISIPEKDPVVFTGVIEGTLAQALTFDGDVAPPPVELSFSKSFPAKAMTFLPGPATAAPSGIFYSASENSPFILMGNTKWTSGGYKIQSKEPILFANNPTCSEPQTISELGSLAEKDNKPLTSSLCPGFIAAMASMGNTLYVARGDSLLALAGLE